MPYHFALPFRYDVTGSPVTVEQDSAADIAQCVQVLLSTPTGTRIESYAYGIPDPTFTTERAAVATITAAVQTWEPRAAGIRVAVAVQADGSSQITATIPDEVLP